MRILMTGAGGNIGKGLAKKLIDLGHDLVLSDLTPLPAQLAELGLPFHQLDVQTGSDSTMPPTDATSFSTYLPGMESTGIPEPRPIFGDSMSMARFGHFRPRKPTTSQGLFSFLRKPGTDITTNTDSQKGLAKSFANITASVMVSDLSPFDLPT